MQLPRTGHWTQSSPCFGLFPAQFGPLTVHFGEFTFFFGEMDFRKLLSGGKPALFFQATRPDFHQQPLNVFNRDIKALGDIGDGWLVGEAGRFDPFLLPQVNDGARPVRRHALGTKRNTVFGLPKLLRHRTILAYLVSVQDLPRKGFHGETRGCPPVFPSRHQHHWIPEHDLPIVTFVARFAAVERAIRSGAVDDEAVCAF